MLIRELATILIAFLLCHVRLTASQVSILIKIHDRIIIHNVVIEMQNLPTSFTKYLYLSIYLSKKYLLRISKLLADCVEWLVIRTKHDSQKISYSCIFFLLYNIISSYSVTILALFLIDHSRSKVTRHLLMRNKSHIVFNDGCISIIILTTKHY